MKITITFRRIMEDKNDIYIKTGQEATDAIRALIKKYPDKIPHAEFLANKIGISRHTIISVINGGHALTVLPRLKISNFLRKVESGEW
jgi:hypothetical protein